MRMPVLRSVVNLNFRRSVMACFVFASWLLVFSLWSSFWWHRHPFAIDWPVQWNWAPALMLLLFAAAVIVLCLDVLRYVRTRKRWPSAT